MDKISFDTGSSYLKEYFTIDIYINGVDLREIIQDIEHEQLNYLANYEGISAFIGGHLHNHFGKDTIRAYRYDDNRFTLYEYACSGEPGDHTLTCKINISKDTVVWSDFNNFSRVSLVSFDYGDLQFSFPRKEYFKAIDRLKREKLNAIYA